MSTTNKISRRSFLALSAWTLTSCGGGDVAGLPGTGGTGITATSVSSYGSVSGLGSIVVNNIKFDDLNALITIDGYPATPADMRLGMVVNVQGERDATGTLGIAKSVDVWSVAQGTISTVATGQFTVAGMTFKFSTATILDGVSTTAQIQPGMRVMVWGLQTSTDARTWTATRVAVTTNTIDVSTGLVQITGSQRTLNGFSLTGSRANDLQSGQLVRVRGNLIDATNTMNINDFKLLDNTHVFIEGQETELEGLITEVLSTTRFKLGLIVVDASTASFSPSSLALSVGTRVEVEGQWKTGQSGSVLVARKIEAEDEDSLSQVEIEGRITEFTSLSNFVLRAQRCDATGVTSVRNGTLADVKLNAKIKVKGNKNGDVVNVTQISIDD